MAEITVRAPRPEEATALTALAHRSKAHWGYSQELLDLWSHELTVSEDDCETGNILVAANEALLGFCALRVEGTLAILTDLWIDPPHIGKGVGSTLFRAVIAEAKARGCVELETEADPNAQQFYERMGMKVVGSRPSTPVGRMLPLLSINIE